MSRSRVRGGVAGLATLAVFAVVVAFLGPSRQVPMELRAEQKPAKKRRRRKGQRKGAVLNRAEDDPREGNP